MWLCAQYYIITLQKPWVLKKWSNKNQRIIFLRCFFKSEEMGLSQMWVGIVTWWFQPMAEDPHRSNRSFFLKVGGVIEGLQYLFGSIGAIGVMGIGYYFGIYIYIQKLIHTYTFTPFVKHSLFRNGGTREIGDD